MENLYVYRGSRATVHLTDGRVCPLLSGHEVKYFIMRKCMQINLKAHSLRLQPRDASRKVRRENNVSCPFLVSGTTSANHAEITCGPRESSRHWQTMILPATWINTDARIMYV